MSMPLKLPPEHYNATSCEKLSSGILPPQCLFCGVNKTRRRGPHELLGTCETLEASQSIQEAALTLNDFSMFSKISGIALIAKEAKYHHSGKSAHLMYANRAKTNFTRIPVHLQSVTFMHTLNSSC